MPVTNQQWDIELNGQGFEVLEVKANAYSGGLGQDRSVSGEFGPAELENQIIETRDVPILFDTFEGGMGYSEKITENAYAWGKNVRTRDPGVVLPGPSINNVALPANAQTLQIKASAEFAGDLYFVAGGTLYKVASGGNTAAIEWTNGPTNTISLGAGFGGTAALAFRHPAVTSADLYVGGTGAPLWRKRAGVWTQASAGGASQPTMRIADMGPVYQVVAGVGSHRIVSADGSDQAQIWTVSADPMVAANWANAGVIEGGYAVKKIATSNRHAYFVTDVGIFDLTEQNYSPNLTPYWRSMQSAENGRAVMVYNGKVLATHYLGLDMLGIASQQRADLSEFAQPGVGASNETPIFGPGTALTNDGGWAVLSLYSGIASYVMYGKERTVLGINGPGQMVWHGAEVYLLGEEITHMVVNNLQGSPRLWIASIVRTTGGSGIGSGTIGDVKLYWCPIPDAASALQDYANSGNHRFNTAYELYLPAETWGDAAKKHTVMRYDVQADNLATDRTIEIQHKAENETSFVSQGSAAGSPRATFYPPGEYKQAYRSFFLIKGTGTATQPPILRAFKVRAGLIQELRETRHYTVRLGGGNSRTGAFDRRSVTRLRDFLYALQTQGPVPIRDELGVVSTVKIESGVRFIVNNDPKTLARQFIAKFDASFITQSPDPGLAVTISESSEKYDNGYTWSDDTGASTNPLHWH